ncbi:Uncharacterized conserved protein YndB, AHSA1/START domain [Pedobacter sp. ok626]|uniref:SRPBCC family protein n=1 Tax=Pedobacter sp. ok626 TaxID=1761882 RepID=UPI000880015E|nr:SRPBCC domain-containing protein [Pedobacter sp. ok626]SDK93753.1 Uncharacterized conserved protein YndB, AHSA1/START domain [Pedobacter sp. ok626]
MPNTNKPYSKNIIINSNPSEVWKALTDPKLMQQWMSESPIEIHTDWTIGSPMIIRGILSQTPFENKGEVLQFNPEKLLAYSHLSSLSNLPEESENYTIIEFQLSSIEKGTSLTIHLRSFPTEIIYKHLVFYWNTTLEILRKFLEQSH